MASEASDRLIFAPPNIFQRIHRIISRLWFELFELGTRSSLTSDSGEDVSLSTIFNILHQVYQDRKLLVKVSLASRFLPLCFHTLDLLVSIGGSPDDL
jgi:hypothetical protein